MNNELIEFQKNKSTDQYIDLILSQINDLTESHRDLDEVIDNIRMNLQLVFTEHSNYNVKLLFALETVYNDITEADSDIISKIVRLRSLVNLIELLHQYRI